VRSAGGETSNDTNGHEGEYAIYCNGKVVALVCDNQLFVKPTEAAQDA
jgi:hypothetical protein